MAWLVVSLLLGSLAFAAGDWTGWLNDWDNSLVYSAPDNWALQAVYSINDNGKEDRRWKFYIAGPMDGLAPGWTRTDYLNNFDAPVQWESSSQVMVGWESYHDNNKEDRRYSVRYRALTGWTAASCYWTTYTNWDAEFTLGCGNGYMFGMKSHHDNGKEDRQYSFKCCNLNDINECSKNNGGCHQNCENMPGSSRCSCNAGYTMNNGICTIGLDVLHRVEEVQKNRCQDMFKISWNTPTVEGREKIRGYSVRVRQAGTTNWITKEYGLRNDLVIDSNWMGTVGVKPKTTYEYEVKALLTDAHYHYESWGRTQTVTTEGIYSSPSVTPLGAGRARVSWAGPAVSGGTYSLEYGVVNRDTGILDTFPGFPKAYNPSTDVVRMDAELNKAWYQRPWDATYRVRLTQKTTVTEPSGGKCPSQISEWRDFKFHCDCADTPVGSNGGGKPSFGLTQYRDIVTVRAKFSSYCAIDMPLKRQLPGNPDMIWGYASAGSQGGAGFCDLLTETTYDLSASDQSFEYLGRNIGYSIYSRNIAAGYTSDVTTVNKQVEWWSNIKGQVTAAGVAVSSVKISWQFVGLNYAGTVVTDVNGAFSLLLQTPLITTQTARLIVTPSYRDPNGEDHRFTCMAPSIAGCKALNEALPVDKRTYQLDINPRHRDSMDLRFYDESSYVIEGRVFVAGTEMWTGLTDVNNDRLPGEACTLQNVTVCPFKHQTNEQTGTCVTVDPTTGKYQLPISMGQSITIRPKFRGDGDLWTVEKDGNKIVDDKIDFAEVQGHKRDYNFWYRTQKAVKVEVTGGACRPNIRLGKPVLQLTLPSSCPKYNQIVTYEGDTKDLSLPPLDFEIQLVKVDDSVLNTPTDQEAHLDITRYLASLQLRTQFVKMFSQISEGKGVAPLNEAGAPRDPVRFEYHSPLIIKPVIGDPSNAKCNGTFVVDKNDLVNITVFAEEKYGTAVCKNVTATLQIKDFLTDKGLYCAAPAGCDAPLSYVDLLGDGLFASAVYTTTIPGEPSLLEGVDGAPDNSRSVVVDYKDPGRPTYDYVTTVHAIVQGSKMLGDSFSVGLTDGVGAVILYDPPGGDSYAELERGTTFTSSFDFESEGKFGGGLNSEFLFGTRMKSSLCTGIGVEMCNQILGAEIKGGAHLENERMNNDKTVHTFSLSFTLTDTVTTSTNPGYAGRSSDVVIVQALSAKFTKTMEVKTKREGNVCDVLVFPNVKWEPAVSGYSVKPLVQIEEFEIPNLKMELENTVNKIQRGAYPNTVDGLDEKSMDLQMVQKLNNSLASWEKIIEDRDSRAQGKGLMTPTDFYSKVQCNSARIKTQIPKNGEVDYVTDKPICNGEYCIKDAACGSADKTLFNMDNDRNRIFFSGGGTSYKLTAELEEAAESSRTQSYDTSNLVGVKFFSSFDIGPVATEIDLMGYVKVTEFWGRTNTQGTVKKNTVSFTLADGDIGDRFDVQLMYDQVYATPYFKLLSGTTSCPQETYTVNREKPVLSIPKSPFTNIAPDAAAVIPIQISNDSPTSEEGTFYLRYDPSTNPDGLTIKVDGIPLGSNGVVIRGVKSGKTLIQTLQAERTPGKFNFPKIDMLLISKCEADLVENGGLFREPLASKYPLTVVYQNYCPRARFAGDFADRPVKNLNKNSATNGKYLIRVQAENPDSSFLKWKPTAAEVYVEYEKVGGSDGFKRAYTSTGTFSVLDEGPSGFASTDVDATQWSNGKYNLRLKSYCSAQEGLVGRYVSETVVVNYDTVAPRQFGSFAEPADGLYWPGREISVTFVENIDCDGNDYEINIEVAPLSGTGAPTTIGKNDLDVRCRDDKIFLAFRSPCGPSDTAPKLDQLLGRTAKVMIGKVSDLYGNVMDGTVTWRFLIGKFDMALATCQIKGLYFKDLKLGDYTNNTATFTKSFQTDVCNAIGCANPMAIEIVGARQGSLILDVNLGNGVNTNQNAVSVSSALLNAVRDNKLAADDYPLLSGASAQNIETELHTPEAAPPAPPRTASPTPLRTASPTPLPKDSHVISSATKSSVGLLSACLIATLTLLMLF